MTKGLETKLSNCCAWILIILLFVFSVKVKGTMSSETRREALTQLNTMEAEMKKATERMKEMEEEKEQARQKERNRQSISTPGSEVKTPRRTPARFGL